MCWVIWIEVVRYGKCQARQYSYKKYAQEIDEILKKVIAMGKESS